MAKVKAIVLRAAGINCDVETEYALTLAGVTAERVHINRVIEDKDLLKQYQIMLFPGGFSYGDDVAAGRILANQIKHHLSDAIRDFVAQGKLVLGICNGFQVLVKMGLLPGIDASGRQENVTITTNDSDKFEARWVYLAPQTERCVFIEKGRPIYLPIAHGEGKLVTADDAALKKLIDDDHVAFTYVDADGNEGPYPINPNGSVASIAGLTDATGRILGLMPHPERFVHPTHHPRWTRDKRQLDPDGRTVFDNAVAYVKGAF